MRQGLEAVDATVEVLQEWAPEAMLRLVYVPSIVTAYEWGDSVRVVSQHGADPFWIATEFNHRRSDGIRAEIRSIAARRGVHLIDATDALRAEGAERPLHGPVDWWHPSPDGYQMLATIITQALEQSPSGS